MKEKTINIVYTNFYDENTGGLSVGGIQTYIHYLSNVIKNIGHKVVIYQLARKAEFEKEFDGIKIKGIYLKEGTPLRKVYKLISEKCKNEALPDDIIIFASEQFIIPTSHYSIAIQHGVAWDKPEHLNLGHCANRIFVFLRSIRAYQRIKKIEKVNKLICVDYNFVNWYRTQVAHQTVKTEVIPNFSMINEYIQRNGDSVNIIFARRFFPYRGTRIFASAIKKIIEKHHNVNVMIAGSGPDEEFLKNKFQANDRVSFTTFNTTDSLDIHKNYDIAVVPTLGSEGTSLSLLEAMAAGCSVIATNVGGMTNIVLDGYNGLLINPDEDSLYRAIEKLITDEKLRINLSKMAYETVQKSFSHKIWEEKWKKVLEEIINE